MSRLYSVSGRTTSEIEQEAYRWREAFGLKNQTNFDILTLVETRLRELISEFRFYVAQVSVQDINDEALTTFNPPKIQLRRDVYAAAQEGVPRARFTIAHELGHLFLHKAFRDAVLARDNVIALRGFDRPKDKFRDPEWQADMFASMFLMPGDLVKDYDNAEEIALDFGVSKTAAVRRLQSVNAGKPREIPEHIKEIINKFKRDNGFPEI